MVSTCLSFYGLLHYWSILCDGSLLDKLAQGQKAYYCLMYWQCLKMRFWMLLPDELMWCVQSLSQLGRVGWERWIQVRNNSCFRTKCSFTCKNPQTKRMHCLQSPEVMRRPHLSRMIRGRVESAAGLWHAEWIMAELREALWAEREGLAREKNIIAD